MILVLLGTQNNSFVRLLKEIEKNIYNGNITDKVIVQAGYTKYKSKKMKIYDFIGPKKMQQLVDEADFIISHGGVGSILQCVKKGKKVIAVPRLKEYSEHVNNHQKQIVKLLNDKKYVIGINEISDLSEALEKAQNFIPGVFISNTENMINIIESYIDRN